MLKAVKEETQRGSEIRTLVEVAPELYLRVNADGIILGDHSAQPAWPFSPPERLAGRALKEVFPINVAELILSAVRRTLVEQQPVQLEYSLPREGAQRWFEMRLAQRGENEVVAAARDVSERRLAELAAAQAHSRRQELIDSLDGIVWEADAQTFSFYFVSKQAERLLGFPVERWLEPGFWISQVHPDDQEWVSGFCSAQTAAGMAHEMEYRMIARDGRAVWLRDLVTVVMDGKRPTTLRGVMVDITQQRKAEEQRDELLRKERVARQNAERAERRAKLLAEAGRVLSGTLQAQAIWSQLSRLAVPVLADWCLLESREEDGLLRRTAVAHADPAQASVAQQLLGAPATQEAEPLLLATRAEVGTDLHPGPALGPARLALLRDLKVRSYLLVPLIARDCLQGVMLLASCQDPERYGPEEMELASDLSNRGAQALDNARLYREAQAAIGARDEFLSVASHELKTPLTALFLQLRRLASEVSNPERMKAAESSARRLGRQVDELLDVSRIRLGRLELVKEPLDLAEVVRATVESVRGEVNRSGSAIQLQLQNAQGSWDRARLEQVVSNLVENALKFGAGKEIEIATLALEAGAVLTVRDHGIGIPSESQARIFERFERAVSDRQFGGLGLGLYIVRQIVEAHGGAIHVESSPQQGSLFRVELPRG